MIFVLLLAACTPGATATPANEASLPTPQAILTQGSPSGGEASAADVSPTPGVTASPTSTPTLTPPQTVQPQGTSTPTASPSSRAACTGDVCIEPGHFFLARPVNSVLGDSIDPSYRFATAQTGTREVHTGVEMPAGFGTPVQAAAAGRVYVAGDDRDIQYGTWKDYYGNLIILEHTFEGFPPVYSLYAHLSKINVVPGQLVSAGEVIGEVGSSGAATGPHLHLEVRAGTAELDGIRNPELWLQPHSQDGVPGGAIAGSITGADGLPRKVELISVQRLDTAGQPTGLAAYIQTYDKKTGRGDDLWKENFALGDLPAGSFMVSFVDLGKVWRQNVQVQPGSVTRIRFKVELTKP